MRRFITAAFLIVATTFTAAAVDIPSSKAQPAAPLPIIVQSDLYAGLNVGMNASGDSVYSGGLVAGYNVLPMLAVEGTYDLSVPSDKINGSTNIGNMLAVNAVPQFKVPFIGITAYALGGLGYKWNTETDNYAIYNVGVGAKYGITSNIDVDVRYRRIEGFEKSNKNPEDRVTLGIQYKF